MRRIVVVGNGIAGLTAADTLRDAGFDGELTIVGDEPAYSRPALSKALLRNDLTAHELPPTTHGATELIGVRATALSVESREVTLDDGELLPFDGLVIATGSRARRLSDLPGELTLRGLSDALALRDRVAERPSVLVIGGGPLGMEVASGCLEAGCAVTLVSQGMPLVAQLGPHLADVFVAAARAHGLTIVESAGARLEERDGVTVAVLAEGSVIGAELVVSAVGDVPNTEWLASSGLCAGGPITVDTRGLVGPGVAAVGDLAAFPSAYGMRRVPLWSSAIEQAKVAARALVLGEEAPELAFQSYFWTEGFGLNLKAVGDIPASEPTYVDGDPADPAAGVLLQWPGAAAALNVRIPIPKLRRLTEPAFT
ncbi:NAD(P)/FAD-dependent oxidoreductase [Nocardioides sp. Kera G14]|uniref:NAD(P)/FAD-dependent oxidoreductase n=1 Tax=Nocardioides sp. Kera G14 TaxID=2884264 RepID=UPI001D125045|nr:FAD/NAD(P)-binding oxidoreductase [Nocardioides sp. Kera G14]UDY23474.1 NAD(P)/FAD-dependent oxidoreductase [Nocardioides sp. Kera G14]